jgi:hypothetical protein
MTWHKNGRRYNPDKLVQPFDGEAWTHFDVVHRDKALEACNVRVALATDGFDPYGMRRGGPTDGWDVVYKVSSHGKLPVPNNEDYNFDMNTYDREFFQEDGLEGTFEIDLTGLIEMEVDNERVVVEDDGDEVQNMKDLQLLERLNLDNDNDENIASMDSDEYIDMADSDVRLMI